MSGSELRAAVLALPLDERADLAHELLLSLDGEVDGSAGDAWDAAIERRANEIKNGSQTESWAVVRERLAKNS